MNNKRSYSHEDNEPGLLARDEALREPRRLPGEPIIARMTEARAWRALDRAIREFADRLELDRAV